MFVRIDDALLARTVSVPRCPGRRPVCADSEVLTVAVVRRLLGRHYFPQVPTQSEFNETSIGELTDRLALARRWAGPSGPAHSHCGCLVETRP